MQARHLQLAYMKEHSLCVCERVYTALFMRREQELEDVQLVPCASSQGLVSSFPGSSSCPSFTSFQPQSLMLLQLSIMGSPHCQPLDEMCCHLSYPSFYISSLVSWNEWLPHEHLSQSHEMAPATALWKGWIRRHRYWKQCSGTGLANISSQHSTRFCSPL